MSLRVAVCDDEQAETEYLAGLVRDWSALSGNPTAVSVYDSAEAFLFAYDGDPAVDILILDIQMKKLDGVALAKRIRAVNKEIQILFVTGYMEYISDGYDVEALQYLLKPAEREKFFAALNRAAEKLAHNERALILSHAGETVRLPLYEIRFAEVMKNYVTLHAGETYTVKKTLSELERELDDSFVRVGRSFIVRLKAIRRVTKAEILLSDGTSIPLPRGAYDAVNRALIERL